MSSPVYRRILLKLSGEVLAGEQDFGIDPTKATELAKEIKSIHEMGVDIILIIGGGNIFRGMQAASKGMDRVTGDYLGMLATIMNAISLQDALEKNGVETRTLSAITVSQILLMLFLRRLNNEWIIMKDLSEQYNQPHYVISKMIKRLRKHDFIEEKKGIDGRFVLLKLNKRAFIFLDTTFNI